MRSSFRSTADPELISRYPERDSEQAGWIVARRGPRDRLDPFRASASLIEEERTETGEVVSSITIFLTNRECPWRCLMCDLWRHTLEESVPAGAIPTQIREALARLPPARRIKLYNAGSFFDPKAIPPSDHEAIAGLLEGFERITVECHPALVGERCFRFHEILGGRLEMAMGLETVHPAVLPRLNKSMTLEQFRRAADLLDGRGIGLRSFVLVGLPFVSAEDSVEWCDRSVEFAFDSGSSVVSLIPTRSGNGALDTLALAGDFLPPTLGMLEETVARGIARRRGRVFADLWDLARLKHCDECFDGRASRLQKINLEQRVPPPVRCSSCAGGR